MLYNGDIRCHGNKLYLVLIFRKLYAMISIYDSFFEVLVIFRISGEIQSLDIGLCMSNATFVRIFRDVGFLFRDSSFYCFI